MTDPKPSRGRGDTVWAGIGAVGVGVGLLLVRMYFLMMRSGSTDPKSFFILAGGFIVVAIIGIALGWWGLIRRRRESRNRPKPLDMG